MGTDKKEMPSITSLRWIYDMYAAGVGYISVINSNGAEGIGSCFHIGDGVFITAKHVVENSKIKEIGTTTHQNTYYEAEPTKNGGRLVNLEESYLPQKTANFVGPFLHPDKNVDVAAIIVSEIKAPILLLGGHLDDWLGEEYILSDAVLMGYPPIPFSSNPLLIVSKCEVNAIVDKYTGGHPQFVLSTMARGGFSGGPAIAKNGLVLGVVTESLISNDQPIELGYLSVLSVEGIYNCISYHRIVPKHIDEEWDGFWNKESCGYSHSSSEHVDISIYRGQNKYFLEVYSYRKDIIENSINIIVAKRGLSYSVEKQNDNKIKIHFEDNSITEDEANSFYSSINKMVKKLEIEGIDIDSPF